MKITLPTNSHTGSKLPAVAAEVPGSLQFDRKPFRSGAFPWFIMPKKQYLNSAAPQVYQALLHGTTNTLITTLGKVFSHVSLKVGAVFVSPYEHII
jgi:hypothetical protein